MDSELFGYIADPFILPLALVVLLVVAAAQDLKTKEVSGWLTLFPLLVTVAWRTATGGWVLLVAFVIIALFSERVACKSRGPSLAAIVTGLVAIFFFLPGSPTYWILLGWLAAWLLWEFNVIGGADVKLMMLLVTVYPDPRMLFLILLAKFVAGFIVPAALDGRRVAGRLISAAFLILAARHLPDRETLEREGLPAVFVYTMAGLAYVLVFAAQRPCMVPQALSRDLPCGVELGAPITWGILALAFALGTVPIALFLRSIPSEIPRTAGRPAGLRSTLPCTGPLGTVCQDKCATSTGGQHRVPPPAGLRSVPSEIPRTAGRPAELRSTLPCTGPLGTVCQDKCATSTGGQYWVPPSAGLRSVLAPGRQASPQPGRLRSPVLGRTGDSAVDCTGRSVPSSTGLPAVCQNGHAGLCRRVQSTHTAQTREE